jgi:leader peptidase (prepilin peptidase)/N-methyltransferase
MNRGGFAPTLSGAAPFLFAALYAVLSLGILLGQSMPLPALLASAPLAAALIALSVIDLRTMRLPNAITLPLIVAGPALTFAFDWGSPLWHIIGGAAGYLLLFGVATAYRALRGREGLGLGDAKLFAAAGSWLGLEALPSVMLWACAAALVTLLFAALRNEPLHGGSRISFGPFLALAFWLVWLYGPLG